MMAKKSDCGLLILFLVAASFLQFVDAEVTCISTRYPLQVKCPDACAAYNCGGEKGAGCPSDFFNDCRYYTTDIDFIKGYNPKKFNYKSHTVYYVSGCEKETGGFLQASECMIANMNEFNGYVQDHKGENPIWNGAEGHQESALKLAGIVGASWILAYFYY